ncbi:MAG TPA: hypothetical protein VF691_22180, partial [Cytophagaceae bacterium]
QLQIDRATAKNYFDNNSKYTIIDITKPLDESAQNTLDNCKICLVNLEIIKEENQALEAIYINSMQEGNIINLSKQALRKDDFKSWSLLNPKHFQQSIVETGYIYSLSPFSGQILRSNQSFSIHYCRILQLLIYRFEDIEVFYLISGGWSGGKICIFFPKNELIINLSPEWGSWLKLPEIINEFKSNAVSCSNQFRAYLLSKNPKKLANIFGAVPNLGHYFWNDVTGVYYLYENNLLEKIDLFLIETQKFLDIKDIFPEISQDKLIYMSEYQDNFRMTLENNYFLVRVTGSYIKEDLANRIYQASIQKCSTGFIQAIADAKQHFPLLWINLRGHNKSWISQVDGYANIVKKLSESYPNIGIFFDGYSSEKETMEKIISLIPPNVKTYNGLDLAIHETIPWSFAIDSYIAVIGSGLTLVSWIASKKGVAHSEKDHYGQMIWWSEVRENSIAPALVPIDCIKEIEGSYPDKGWLNYDCDWQVIYEEIAKVISSLAISREAQDSDNTGVFNAITIIGGDNEVDANST